MKLLLSFIICFTSLLTIKANTENILSAGTVKQSKTEYEEVLSYVDVMQTYYEIAKGNIETDITFEAFMNNYYSNSNNLQFYDYLINFSEQIHSNVSMIEMLNYNRQRSSGIENNGGVSGKDASYILTSSASYIITPMSAFARPIYRSVYNYSNLEDGDIIWETETVFFDVGHNAIIEDTDKVYDQGLFIETIEAVGGGVQRGFLDDLRMVQYKCVILRPINNTTSIANKAIYFAKRQLGKGYFLDITSTGTSIDEISWYCSELVYASYLYAGIDICNMNGQTNRPCYPSDIANSNKIETVPTNQFRFLKLTLLGKSGDTWNVRIENPSLHDVTLEYNKKMCFLDDGKKWKCLNDLAAINLSQKGSVDVGIHTNWFADAITTSYKVANLRFVTYANQLNTNGTMSVFNNIIMDGQTQ